MRFGDILPSEAHNDRSCTTIIVFWLFEKLDNRLLYSVKIPWLRFVMRW